MTSKGVFQSAGTPSAKVKSAETPGTKVKRAEASGTEAKSAETKSGLTNFYDACRKIFDPIEPLPPRLQPSAICENFVLAQDVRAQRTSPAVDLSAMDGYGVRARDVIDGCTLGVIGRVQAGQSAQTLNLGPGQAVRLFTGAALPPGADAVLIQENCQALDDAGKRIEVRLTDDSQASVAGSPSRTVSDTDGASASQALLPGTFVRPRGLDFHHGDILFTKGKKIRPQSLALLVGAGLAEVSVVPRPRVKILSTGDELVDVAAWDQNNLHKIPSSNAPMLRAVLASHGFQASILPTVEDDIDRLADCFRALAGDTDLVISTGGASVGDHDIVRQFLAANAQNIQVEKIAMRPGKPVMLARINGVLWLALPGNPASSFVTGLIFGVGICRRLSGQDGPWPRVKTARLTKEVPANDHRVEFMRASIEDGQITPLPRQDSSLIATLAQSNSLMVRPADGGQMLAGDQVQYIALDQD